MIDNKYKIEKYLSQGTFGSVYKCSYNNKSYAVKCEYNSIMLKHEANIYKDLKLVKNISQLIDFFLYNNKYYLVLNLFNLNLKDYKYRFYNSEYYLERLVEIMNKVIDTLKDIHNCGIVHRDLKPQNICLNSNLQPYIIDFGMAKKIIINNKHIEEKYIKNIIGSPNYISLNVLNLIEPSRRDDMESIIYIVIYMLLSKKDYIKYTNNTLNIQKSITKLSEIILENNINLNILNLLIYIRKLRFCQSPNYSYLKL